MKLNLNLIFISLFVLLFLQACDSETLHFSQAAPSIAPEIKIVKNDKNQIVVNWVK